MWAGHCTYVGWALHLRGWVSWLLSYTGSGHQNGEAVLGGAGDRERGGGRRGGSRVWRGGSFPSAGRPRGLTRTHTYIYMHTRAHVHCWALQFVARAAVGAAPLASRSCLLCGLGVPVPGPLGVGLPLQAAPLVLLSWSLRMPSGTMTLIGEGELNDGLWEKMEILTPHVRLGCAASDV